ncbi:response regulator [Streptomyces albidoflavus]
MADFKPLSPHLPVEARDLAQALRDLLNGMAGYTLRRYAARRNRDVGSVSRYFNGTRRPPWEFVIDLVTDLTEHRGAGAPTVETLEHLRKLHTAWEEKGTRASPDSGVEILTQQLAAADRLSRVSSAQSHALGEALADRQHRIADLEVRLQLVEADLARATAQAEEETPELARLRHEVDQLAAKLREVEGQRQAAEERCALLERQLQALEDVQEQPLDWLPPAREERGPLPRILVVDDDEKNLLVMRAVLETLDQEIVSVDSGREALKALLDHDDFAVIIMDVQMPEMDGYETAAQIKRRPRNRDVPIIFLTAMIADPEHVRRGYAAGAVDYMSKPFDPWALRAKVAVFTSMYLDRGRR